MTKNTETTARWHGECPTCGRKLIWRVTGPEDNYAVARVECNAGHSFVENAAPAHLA